MPPSASPCLLVLLAAACGADPGYAPEARDTTVPADVSPDTSPTGDVAALADDAAAGATVTVIVVATIPVETPSATPVVLAIGSAPERLVTLDCGAATTRCEGRLAMPAGNGTSLALRLADGRQALNLDGTARAVEPLALPEAERGPWTVRLQAERWGTPSASPTPAVAFIVRPPASTPPHEALFVAGSLPALGAWDGRGLRLEAAREGAHAAVLEGVPGGTDLAFKVTRGSWYTVEKGPGLEEIANRAGRVEPGRVTRVEATPARWADVLEPGTGTLTGEVRRWEAVASAHLGATRDVLVWVPPGYRDDETRRYPVLYAHDGQNMMDAETAFGGFEWGLDEALDAAVRAGDIPPVIAVAVGNTADRIDEYTPTASLDYGGGGLPDYGRFLAEELKPLIDGQFRTRTDAPDTGVMGSSLGGLASMWLGLAHADVFGRLGVISPSVWWDGRAILGAVRGFEGTPAARVWVDIGTDEGDGAEPVADARALRDALVARGWAEGGNLAYREYDGAAHNEAAWADRLPEVVRFLMAGPR